jgi:hypothetical protein
VPYLQYIPGATKSWDQIKIVGEQTVKTRVAAGSREKDLFYHLVSNALSSSKMTYASKLCFQMDEEGHEPVRPTVELCAVDGQLAVIVRIEVLTCPRPAY